jgi:hypothetical protein
MKSNRSYFIALASLSFLALASFCSPVKAQTAAYQGSFRLPYEVTWQNSQMPAGEYTFTMESKAFPSRVVVQGPNGTIFVSAIGLSDEHSSDNSELSVETRDGKHYVRDLYLAELDLHFRYSVPKMKDLSREVLLAQGPSNTDHLAVLKARK